MFRVFMILLLRAKRSFVLEFGLTLDLLVAGNHEIVENVVYIDHLIILADSFDFTLL